MYNQKWFGYLRIYTCFKLEKNQCSLIAFNRPFNAYTYFYLHYLNIVETGANPYLHCTYIYSINTTLVNNKSSCQIFFSLIFFSQHSSFLHFYLYIKKLSYIIYNVTKYTVKSVLRVLSSPLGQRKCGLIRQVTS